MSFFVKKKREREKIALPGMLTEHTDFLTDNDCEKRGNG